MGVAHAFFLGHLGKERLFLILAFLFFGHDAHLLFISVRRKNKKMRRGENMIK